MRIPIAPFSRRAFDIDEFQEHECDTCKHCKGCDELGNIVCEFGDYYCEFEENK